MANKRSSSDMATKTTDKQILHIKYQQEQEMTDQTRRAIETRPEPMAHMIAERKKWRKFGSAADDRTGADHTIKMGADVSMHFVSNNENTPLQSVQNIPTIQRPSSNMTRETPRSGSYSVIHEINSETATRKYVPPHARRPASSSTNDVKKPDDAVICVSNLPEETDEEDLLDLFDRFGQITRVRLTQDKRTDVQTDLAFVTFKQRKDAQMAIDCINGFGYGHLILSVGWASK